MRVAAVWVLGGVLWVLFVARTSIGPVVYSLGWDHGVHATDVLCAILVVATCGTFTLLALGLLGGRSAVRSSSM